MSIAIERLEFRMATRGRILNSDFWILLSPVVAQLSHYPFSQRFDKRQFLLYSYKGLASCVFCSRATAL